MNVTIHPNQYLSRPLSVHQNGSDRDLLVLDIVEESGSAHTTDARVVLSRAAWQQVVDSLATHQVVASDQLAPLYGAR